MYKINRIHIYSILLGAFLLDLTFLNYIKIFGAKPDLLLSAVIFFGLFLGWRMGLESALAAGLIKDIFGLSLFWLNTLTLGFIGLLTGILSTKFFKESKATQGIMVFSMTALSMALRFLAASFITKSIKINFGEFFYHSILPTSIYTTLVSIPVYSKFMDLFKLKAEDEDLL